MKENCSVSVLWRNSLLRYSLPIADNNSLVLLYFEYKSKGFLTLSLSLFALKYYPHGVINSKNKTVENSNCVDYELLLARISLFYTRKFWKKVAGERVSPCAAPYFSVRSSR